MMCSVSSTLEDGKHNAKRNIVDDSPDKRYERLHPRPVLPAADRVHVRLNGDRPVQDRRDHRAHLDGAEGQTERVGHGGRESRKMPRLLVCAAAHVSPGEEGHSNK
jgi:hypothetical protein